MGVSTDDPLYMQLNQVLIIKCNDTQSKWIVAFVMCLCMYLYLYLFLYFLYLYLYLYVECCRLREVCKSNGGGSARFAAWASVCACTRYGRVRIGSSFSKEKREEKESEQRKAEILRI